ADGHLREAHLPTFLRRCAVRPGDDDGVPARRNRRRTDLPETVDVGEARILERAFPLCRAKPHRISATKRDRDPALTSERNAAERLDRPIALGREELRPIVARVRRPHDRAIDDADVDRRARPYRATGAELVAATIGIDRDGELSLREKWRHA